MVDFTEEELGASAKYLPFLDGFVIIIVGKFERARALILCYGIRELCGTKEV